MSPPDITTQAFGPLHNRSFDEIAVGDSASLQRTLTAQDLQLYALLTGNDGVAPSAAAEAGTSSRGVWAATMLSSLLATRLPGPGTKCLRQAFELLAPVRVGELVTATVTVSERDPATRRVGLDFVVHNAQREAVITGRAEVIALAERIEVARRSLPVVHMHDDGGSALQRLLDHVRPLGSIRVAVVHPCDAVSLSGALDARAAGLIEPLLVGPRARLEALARDNGLDLAGITIEDVPHSHAAAARAAELALHRKVEALMKGSLHTDELLGAIIQGGLRTKRRLSHCFLMHTPAYPKPFIITDAAVNIAPDLAAKADIIRNAIALAHVIGVERPRVAILAAVETVNAAMPATLDAAALCKMADRGQIEGGVLDGPLAFDNAVSVAAARIKGIDSPVAGQADILVVPDLESGNMLAKQLEHLGDASSAGIVLGAKVPVVLTSRADPLDSRIASCAIAVLLAQRYRVLPP